MGEPKRQHFIPKSYLKSFAKKGEKDDIYLVDTLMKGQDKEILTLPTVHICLQKNLYTLPLGIPGDRFALEKFYAVEVDAVYPQVYKMLTDPSVVIISDEEKRKILNTILSLFFRTPRFLNYKTEDIDMIFNKIAETVTNPEQEITIGLKKGEEIKFKRKDLESARLERKEKIKEEFLINHLANWRNFVDYKMECEMEVLTVSDDVPIITSDNPVIIMDIDGKLNLENIFHPNNIIEVPIDRNTYLVIYPNSVSESSQPVITRSKRDKIFTAGTNNSTEKNSDLRLIGYPGDLSIHFDSQQSLGEFNTTNIQSFTDLLKKTSTAMELTSLIKKNQTAICQEVADKVKEIRITKIMEGEENFEMLVVALEKKGYSTI